MYKTPTFKSTSINRNTGVQGKTIEEEMHKLLVTGEAPEGEKPKIYTPRENGVVQSTNIKTDRFDVALNACDKIQKSFEARRLDNHKPKEETIVADESAEGTEE